jgi:hypothetical protein
MIISFKNELRNKKIKSPNEKGFDPSLWEKKWIECGAETPNK